MHIGTWMKTRAKYNKYLKIKLLNRLLLIKCAFLVILNCTLFLQSLGNHEFDEAVDGLIPFLRNLTSPTVTANLLLNKVPELREQTNLHNSIIINKNGINIGIVGYLTPETKFLAPKTDVDYEDEIIALKREVKKLKLSGIKILIALGHSGYYKDLEIAENVEDLDLVVGGHSNTFLTNLHNSSEIPEYRQGPYPTVVEQASGRKVLVVQAYAYTKYLGKLSVTFDDKGEINDYHGEPILLDKNIPEDPEVLKLVESYRTGADFVYSEVMGSSLVLLDGDSCRIKECNLGNFLNDAVINYTTQYNEDYSDITIAIIQGGRIRTSISHPKTPFNVTRGDLITVIPFSDTLCILNVNGTILKLAIEHSIENWRKIDSSGQFLQYSGIQVVYDLARKPGSRIVKAKGICTTCSELSDIDDHLQYKIMMSYFLADGGDGYDMFQNIPREIVPYNEITCAIDYLNKYSPINPTVSKRIVILNEDKVKEEETLLISKGHSTNLSFILFLCVFIKL